MKHRGSDVLLPTSGRRDHNSCRSDDESGTPEANALSRFLLRFHFHPNIAVAVAVLVVAPCHCFCDAFTLGSAPRRLQPRIQAIRQLIRASVAAMTMGAPYSAIWVD